MPLIAEFSASHLCLDGATGFPPGCSGSRSTGVARWTGYISGINFKTTGAAINARGDRVQRLLGYSINRAQAAHRPTHAQFASVAYFRTKLRAYATAPIRLMGSTRAAVVQ